MPIPQLKSRSEQSMHHQALGRRPQSPHLVTRRPKPKLYVYCDPRSPSSIAGSTAQPRPSTHYGLSITARPHRQLSHSEGAKSTASTPSECIENDKENAKTAPTASRISLLRTPARPLSVKFVRIHNPLLANPSTQSAYVSLLPQPKAGHYAHHPTHPPSATQLPISKLQRSQPRAPLTPAVKSQTPNQRPLTTTVKAQPRVHLNQLTDTLSGLTVSRSRLQCRGYRPNNPTLCRTNTSKAHTPISSSKLFAVTNSLPTSQPNPKVRPKPPLQLTSLPVRDAIQDSRHIYPATPIARSRCQPTPLCLN